MLTDLRGSFAGHDATSLMNCVESGLLGTKRYTVRIYYILALQIRTTVLTAGIGAGIGAGAWAALATEAGIAPAGGVAPLQKNNNCLINKFMAPHCRRTNKTCTIRK